jgi:hypothetical protein
MPRFAVVSRERHGRKKWLRFNGYGFAATSALAPIAAIELARAATVSMPCAFLQDGGRYTLVAVLSLVPGRNMFVAPGGRWLGGYVPAFWRLYPFRMLAPDGAGEPALCVDEESGLVVEGSAAGEEFFDAEGNHTAALDRLVQTLMQVERSRVTTEAAVAALAQARVIRPWQFKVRTDQGEQAVSGLYRVDEAALRALPNDVFLKLRATPALPLAYAQMLSAGQIGIFEQLARQQQQQPAASPLANLQNLPQSLDDFFENLKDDTLRFD